MTRHPCYAQAIRWDAWATPIWAYPSHTRIKPHKDKNRVTGVIGAGANAKVLRGKEPTTVEVCAALGSFRGASRFASMRCREVICASDIRRALASIARRMGGATARVEVMATLFLGPSIICAKRPLLRRY